MALDWDVLLENIDSFVSASGEQRQLSHFGVLKQSANKKL
jgi:hypothetical protein